MCLAGYNNRMLMKSLKRTGIVLIVVAVIWLLFWSYNRYLLNRSSAYLKVVLGSATTGGIASDSKGFLEMLDNSLLDEVTGRTLQVKTFSYVEMAKAIFDQPAERSQLKDAQFMLNEAITEQKKQRNALLVWLDNLVLRFTRKKPADVRLDAQAINLEGKISAIRDSNELQGAYYDLGGMYIKMRNIEKAKRSYLKAADLIPETALAEKSRFNLAWIEKFSGNLDEALKQFEYLSTSSTDTEMAAFCKYQVAEIHKQKGEFVKAADIHTEIAQEYAGSSVADISELQAGQIYLNQLKDYKKAQEIYSKIEKAVQDPGIVGYVKKVKLPDLSLRYNLMGYRLLGEGFRGSFDQKYIEALAYFEKALQVSPDDGMACMGLALASLWSRRSDAALEFARKSIGYMPRNEFISSNACYIFMQLNMSDDLLLESKRFISANSSSSIGFFNLGYVYASRHQFEEAEGAFRKSISLNSQYAPAYINLGYCLWYLAQYPESIEAFEKALIIDADLVEAYFNLGLVYAAIGKYENSRRSLQSVLDINPRHLDARLSLDEIERIIREESVRTWDTTKSF